MLNTRNKNAPGRAGLESLLVSFGKPTGGITVTQGVISDLRRIGTNTATLPLQTKAAIAYMALLAPRAALTRASLDIIGRHDMESALTVAYATTLCRTGHAGAAALAYLLKTNLAWGVTRAASLADTDFIKNSVLFRKAEVMLQNTFPGHSMDDIIEYASSLEDELGTPDCIADRAMRIYEIIADPNNNEASALRYFIKHPSEVGKMMGLIGIHSNKPLVRETAKIMLMATRDPICIVAANEPP